MKIAHLAYSCFLVPLLAHLVSCGEDSDLSSLKSQSIENPLASLYYVDFDSDHSSNNRSIGFDDFIAEPGACDDYYSGAFYCSGYSAMPKTDESYTQEPTPESHSSTPAIPYFNGIQVIGNFDPDRPSILYIHGWNRVSKDIVKTMPDYWVMQAQNAGFNTLFFHWAEMSYDDGNGCLGLGIFGGPNIPCNASYNSFKSEGIADIFLDSYRELFMNTNGSVRVVAHSVGSVLAVLSSYVMQLDPRFENVAKPSRIDLIDPFVSVGLGANRSKPYDGQIPHNDNLLPVYKDNVVKDFVSGSVCRSKWRFFIPPNHHSQYCQVEGMTYKLIKEYQVPTFVLSSIVSTITTRDLSKVAVMQSFADQSLKLDLMSKHSTPIASYMYSFAPGEPDNGLDASSSDDVLLDMANEQVLDRVSTKRRQTAGFDTVKLADDEYELF